ncbi:MAG: 50S ribosomal protein L28 [Candidatus Peregrinibacteria bacterium]
MSKVCQITGKKPSVGNNVSHSMRHTKRRFLPNLHKRRVFNPATGKVEVMRISTQGMRTLLKARMVKKAKKA